MNPGSPEEEQGRGKVPRRLVARGEASAASDGGLQQIEGAASAAAWGPPTAAAAAASAAADTAHALGGR